MATLERAIEIAHVAHEGQFRKDGAPFVEHPLRVMRAVGERGYSLATQMVAALHDVPEDNPIEWPLERLHQEGFDEKEVLEPLGLLAKQDGESYDEYIARLLASNNLRAWTVKLYDIMDNLRDYPLGVEPTDWRKRKITEYTGALGLLLSSAAWQRV